MLSLSVPRRKQALSCPFSLGEGALQLAVLAELKELLFGLIALGTNGGHPLGRGLLHPAFAQFHALLDDLLLAFGFLEAGVFLGVDLREAVQLLPQCADLSFELVVLAPFGLEQIGGPTVVGSDVAGGRCSSQRLRRGRRITGEVVATLGISTLRWRTGRRSCRQRPGRWKRRQCWRWKKQWRWP